MDLETGAFSQAEWPAGWDGLRQRLAGRAAWEPPRMPRADFGELPFVLVVPRFGRPPEPGPPQRTPPVRREMTFLILEVNPDYVRESMMPELVQRYFGSGDALEYQVEIVTRDNPQAVVYQSEGFGMQRIGGSADASAPILELQFDQFERRRGPLTPGDMGRRRMGGGPEGGRWLLAARHRAGSLDAVVARARWKNLAVTSLVLLLMLAAAGTLIRATRRAQQLAGLQMDFVTGVSHELRTPLTVIRTAAYNLRGKMAQNPAQVERYGGLIQKESEKLTGRVEQVLQFASLKAGKILRGKESLSVETLVEESLESSRAVLETARCNVERRIEPELPAIHGDPLALRLAVENLLGNAAKYGADSGGWIGLECSRVAGRNGPEVEIAVTDRGPGIPREEQGRIFDAFYRGRRAIEDQVHGTGLGLSLVKGIVEAHGGTVTVESEPGRGSRFAIRVPAAESEGINEFTDSAG
jgi:signal transduction histidine kinase